MNTTEQAVTRDDALAFADEAFRNRNITFSQRDVVDMTGALNTFLSRHRLASVSSASAETPGGTFACPICGKDTPHYHSPEEVAQHRETEAWVEESWQQARPLFFPEPVPATNQAGEVERHDEVISEFAFLYYAYGTETDDKLDPDALALKRKVLAAVASPTSEVQTLRAALIKARHYAERKSWDAFDDREDQLLAAIDAALATQPATSQEGEDKGNHDCLAKRRPGEPMFILLGRDPDAWQIVQAWADRRLAAGGDPHHVALGLKTANAMRDYAADPANRPASAPAADVYPILAATPTPPTLSEDALGVFGAAMFQRIWDSFTDDGWDIEINDLVTVEAVKAGLVSVAPYDPEVHNDQSGAAEIGDDFYEVTQAGRDALARAQVKPS